MSISGYSESIGSRNSDIGDGRFSESMADNDSEIMLPLPSLPLSITPFAKNPKVDEDGRISYSERIPWSDLLHEIAMVVAFASLTDRASIQTGTDIASFVSFFFLVWWIWASQVIYNVHFRQSDWFHFLLVGLQLLVFGSLATFTSNFRNGLVFGQDTYLSVINAKGISITMGCSRLLLLIQYLLTCYYTFYLPAAPVRSRVKSLLLRSLAIHIASLLISAVCFFIASAIIEKPPDTNRVTKLILLWFIPLFLEIPIHFYTHRLRNRAGFNHGAEEINERSTTVFIIVSGVGLHKITNGVRYFVGTTPIGHRNALQISCAVIIFVLHLALYFKSSGRKMHGRMVLVHFFFHFFFLSTLLLTLQGIASMLLVGNLTQALDTPFQFAIQSKALLESGDLSSYVNESDYSDSLLSSLVKTGIDIDSLIRSVNAGINYSTRLNDRTIPYNTVLYEDMSIITTVLKNLDAMPTKGTPLRAQLDAFSSNNTNNLTAVDPSSFFQIVNLIVTTNATPALWFYVAGGFVFISFALMSFMKTRPRDRYAWSRLIKKIILGVFVICFTASDSKANSDIISEDFTYEGSGIWFLATNSWILLPYALALLVEVIVELVLDHLVRRKRRRCYCDKEAT